MLRRAKAVVLLMIFAFVSPTVCASKEGVLPWTEFSIKSAGMDESGPVEITGTQTTDGVTKLQIVAFGRRIIMSDAQLLKLRGLYVNAVQLSYEVGLKKQGRRVYLQLSTGFASGISESRKIVITETGVATFLPP